MSVRCSSFYLHNARTKDSNDTERQYIQNWSKEVIFKQTKLHMELIVTKQSEGLKMSRNQSKVRHFSEGIYILRQQGIIQILRDRS